VSDCGAVFAFDAGEQLWTIGRIEASNIAGRKRAPAPA
jgi:hypothetical protein